MSAINNAISATDVAKDLLVVKIVNPHYRYDSFEYVIYSNENKILRKGTFRAPQVQLRTIDMNEGTWHIRLLHKGQEWKTRDFEKQNNYQFQSKKENVIYFL